MSVILFKNYSLIGSIFEDINCRLTKNQSDTFIYIVPTRRKVRELQRELLKIVPKKTAEAFNIYTLETFALELHKIFCLPKKKLNIITQSVLFNEAINNKLARLKYFFPHGIKYSIPKGTLEKIINVINHLKETGVYPSLLYEEIESAETDEKQKLLDILSIYEEYESLLKDKFIDSGGIYKEINEKFESLFKTSQESTADKLFRNRFPKISTIFVTGFDEFFNTEITMLDFVSILSKLGMVISFDYYPGNSELFEHLKENYDKFIKLGFIHHTEKSQTEKSFTNHIINNLFKSENVLLCDYSRNVTVLQANNREEEVEFIAKTIKKLYLEKPDRDLSKICVSIYQPQTYTKLFHEIFPRFGIPVNITDRYPLEQSPLVVSILSLLNIRQNNFRQRDIMRALSSPYFSFNKADDKIDVGNLYSVSVSLKINAGLDFWKIRIASRIDQINNEINSIEDEFELKNLEIEAASLKKAKDDINTLEKILEPFNDNMTPVEFRNKLNNLLHDLRLVDNILKFKTDNFEQTEKDTRAYQKFLTVLDELVSLFFFQNKSKTTEPLKFYIDQLKVAVSQTRYNIRQKYGYGVYVTSMEETRGLNFDVMFIAGLIDGEFPPAYQPEIFFSKNRQQKEETYHLTENRYLFYQCLTNFSEHLFLTYSNKDGEMDLVPSSFLDSVYKTILFEDFREIIPEYITKPVYNEEELLQRIGHNAGIGITHNLNNKINENILNIIDDIYFAINVENDRSSQKQKREYNGYIYDKLNDVSQKKLDNSKNKIYSVSQLEKYAECPFKYFIENILNINTISELEEGITPLEKGSILHEALFKFYIDRRTNNLPLMAECNEQEYRDAVDELLKITQEILNSLSSTDLLAFLEKELILGNSSRAGIVREFLEKEKNRELEVTPSYFELPFGPRVGSRRKADPLLDVKDAIEVGKVKLRGKVDRVEIGKKHFTVVDYKSGTGYPAMQEIMDGMKLQMPIYLYVIEKIIKENLKKELDPAAGIHYQLKSPVSERIILGNKELKGTAYIENKQKSGFVSNSVELREIIKKAIEYVNNYVEAISRGEFPITTELKMKKVCKNCSFDKICRKQTTIEITDQNSVTE